MSKVQLYFLRHADAGDPLAWEGADEERPLSPKGQRQADRLSDFLLRGGFVVDTIVSSPKRRADQTARRLAQALGLAVRLDQRLAGSVGLAELERIIDEAGSPGRIVLVGHDPDFSALVSRLCGTDAVSMAKGALARVDADRPLAPGRGRLRWLVPPDLLRGSRARTGPPG